LTRRELNLAIFKGTARTVLWQPRLETWIGHHALKDTLPRKYRGLDALGIYDALRCSPRYGGELYYTAVDCSYDPGAMTEASERQGNYLIETLTLPAGSLRTIHRERWEDGILVNRRIERYPVTTREDLHLLIDLVECQRFSPNLRAYAERAAQVGERGELTVGLSSSGFTELIKSWCGLENTFYLLADYPEDIQAYLEACDRRDDRLLDAALELPCRIFNFGDHANNYFTPPPILKRYMLPRWQRLSARLRAAGRFSHSHWDGNARTILPYLLDSGLDAVEALPPAPMGDMTLEDIKAAVRDKMVVLDLLPTILFLPQYTLEETLEFARRTIDMFAPRLILGISDEISQVGQIEKVEAISELVSDTCGLAE